MTNLLTDLGYLFFNKNESNYYKNLHVIALYILYYKTKYKILLKPIQLIMINLKNVYCCLFTCSSIHKEHLFSLQIKKHTFKTSHI